MQITYFISILQVFDGHGGKHAADFACHHLPRLIVHDEEFPQEVKRVLASAFLQTDTAFAEACSSNADLASGTTALAAVITGRLAFGHTRNFLLCFCVAKKSKMKRERVA